MLGLTIIFLYDLVLQVNFKKNPTCRNKFDVHRFKVYISACDLVQSSFSFRYFHAV